MSFGVRTNTDPRAGFKIRMDASKAMALLGFPSSKTLEHISVAEIQSAFMFRVHALELSIANKTGSYASLANKKDELRKVNEAYQFLTRKSKRLSGRTMEANWQIGGSKTKFVNTFLSIAAATKAARELENGGVDDDDDERSGIFEDEEEEEEEEVEAEKPQNGARTKTKLKNLLLSQKNDQSLLKAQISSSSLSSGGGSASGSETGSVVANSAMKAFLRPKTAQTPSEGRGSKSSNKESPNHAVRSPTSVSPSDPSGRRLKPSSAGSRTITRSGSFPSQPSETLKTSTSLPKAMSSYHLIMQPTTVRRAPKPKANAVASANVMLRSRKSAVSGTTNKSQKPTKEVKVATSAKEKVEVQSKSNRGGDRRVDEEELEAIRKAFIKANIGKPPPDLYQN